MALYLGALTLSLFQAIDWREAIAELLKWVEFILVLLLVREVLPPARIPWLVAALLFGASAQAVLGLYQFIFRIGPDWFIVLGRFMRASGSFRQPNPFAGYMGLTLPVAFSLAWWAWGNVASGWRSREDRRLEAGGGALNKPSSRLLRIEDWPTAPRKKIWCWVIFYSAVTGLLALGLLASWSRGGWLGAAAGLTVVLLMHSRRASWLAGLGMLLVLSLALMDSFTPTLLPTALRARLQDIPTFLRLTDVLSQPVTDDNFSVVERVAHWAAALRMWEQAPWLGVGPGNYAVVYPTVRLPRWEEALGHAHNIYLNVLGENGLVGLAAYLLTWSGIVAWVWRRHRHWQASGASWRTAVAIGLLGVLAHLSVHHFFDNLFVQGLYLQVALWLALIESDMRR
jgi:O-antigen ligase